MARPATATIKTTGSDAAAAVGLELRLLGAPCLVLGPRRISLSAKDAALLCLAALAGPIRADRVACLLWPAVAAKRADTSLRQRLYRLRHETGVPLLSASPLLQLSADVQTDLAPCLERIGRDEHASLDELLGASTTTICLPWPIGCAINACSGARSAMQRSPQPLRLARRRVPSCAAWSMPSAWSTPTRWPSMRSAA